MNLKLVFRIFAGFGAFFALMSLLATDAMMESYGTVSYTHLTLPTNREV